MADPIAAFIYTRRLVNEDADFSEIHQQSIEVRNCLNLLIENLSACPDSANESEIQSIYYEAGKLHFAKNLRYWFQVIYQILLRQNDGPRLGQFTQLMTIHWVIGQIQDCLVDPWQKNLTT